MSNGSNRCNLNFAHLLLLLFIGLKLTNNIDWSWWWVFTPFYAIFFVACIRGFCQAYYQESDKNK